MSNPNPVVPVHAQFKPGNTAARSDIKRGKDTISKAFLKAIVADFDKHGETAIQTLRTEDIGTYCRLAASFVPKEIEVTSPFDELDREQLTRLLAGLDALIAREDSGADRDLGQPEPAPGLQTLQ